jgi:hypothetical protein
MDAPSPAARKDLEKLVPVDIPVSFGRPEPRDFIVPGDFPLEPYLHWTTALNDDTDETTGTKHLQACLLKLLTWYDDSQDTVEFVTKQIQRLGVRSIIAIVQSIYEQPGDAPADAADGDEPATVDAGPTSSGTTPTTIGTSPESESLTPPVELATPKVPTGAV